MEQYNPWWVNEPDIMHEQWLESKIHWVPELVNKINLKPFSLHFISGSRQVGKTTAIKILIQQLIKKRPPKSIFYYSCDELSDYHELSEILDNYLSARKSWHIKNSVIFLDEITFVKDWWRSIKNKIDSGQFNKDVVIITGSASIDLLKQKETFPGRRGNGKDFLLYPLDFSSYVKVREGLDIKYGNLPNLESNLNANKLYSNTLSKLFSEYLKIGGFPRSIQDYTKYGKVTVETARTYIDWLKGDWARVGKSDKFMKEIISYIIRAGGTPISWNSISNQTSINSPNTVRSYMETLEGIQSIIVLNLLTPDFRIDYKKNKKVHFIDPFIFKILGDYAFQEPSEDWILEATVASHLSRVCPIYYWRNRTEVDVVCRQKKSQVVGFEVTKGLKKWKAPWHIRKSYLLDKNNIYLYLSALGTS